jgi:hypothetical protein
MIGTIRKHSKWLWLVIITVTIITFVSWQSPSSRYDRQMGYGNFGAIDGQRITKDEYLQAQNEVYLRYFLTRGDWPDRDPRKSGFDSQRETYYWLFIVRKLKEYDIRVDSAAVARAANDVLSGLGRGQRIPLDRFLQLLQPHGLGAHDLERFLRHDLARQQMVSVVGMSGRLITPDQAQSLYEHDHRELVTEAVFYSGSNYLATIPMPAADALSQYYTNQAAVYRVPTNVQVSYVAFSITNLLAQAEAQITNLTEIVEANLRQLGTNYLRFGKTPEEVKGVIRERVIRDRATAEARGKANEFINTLLDLNPVEAGNLAAVARTNGFNVKMTKPFDEENGPSEFDGGPNFARAAFLLTPDRPFSEQSIEGADALYVIALEKKIPSEIPPLDRIRDRVTADYRWDQAVALARRAGDALVQSATNGLAQGKTFAAICAAAGVKPVSVPPFSILTRELPVVEDHLNLNLFKRVALVTPPGRVSGYAPPREAGSTAYLAVYVDKRLPVDQAKMKAELPEFLEAVRRARQQEALSDWFNREASKSLGEILQYLEKSSSTANQSRS